MARDAPFLDDLRLLRLMLDLEEQGRLHVIWGEQLLQEAGGRAGEGLPVR